MTENKIHCGCGSYVCKSSYSTHITTSKHKKFIKSQVAQLDDKTAISPPPKKIKTGQQPLSLNTPTLKLFIARRGSGKSHLMKSILHTCMKQKRFEWVYVFSLTAFNKEWSNVVGPKNVCADFSPAWITSLMKAQSKLVEKGKIRPGLIIFDDMVGTAKWKDPVITQLAIASRHYHITVWISSQYYTSLPPLIRQNADYCFLLNTINETVSKKLAEEFPTSQYPKWQDLMTFAEEATQDHGVFFINNIGNVKITQYRAPAKLEPFTIKHKR